MLSAERLPTFIRQMKPLRDPIHSLIEAANKNTMQNVQDLYTLLLTLVSLLFYRPRLQVQYSASVLRFLCRQLFPDLFDILRVDIVIDA